MKCVDSLIFLLVLTHQIAANSQVAAQTSLVRAAGNHIRLTTDGDPTVAQEMVTSLDAAVNLWAQRWGIQRDQLNQFRVDAFVIHDEKLFRERSMLPAELPAFEFGYALDDRVFVRSQPGAYYSRHLLLHEAAHSFGFKFFGSLGPTWFREGTAEMMATHRGVGPSIEIGVMPESRQTHPYWGRFKEIAEVRKNGELPPLEKVMRYAPTLAGDVRSYSFSWAAISMLNAYPDYHDLLAKAARFQATSDDGFNQQFAAAIRPGWPVLAARWRLWLDELDYGFETQRHLVKLSVTDPAIGASTNLSIAADKGWQSIGYRIPAGTELEIRATGTATINHDPAPWTSHPNGVSLRYVRDRPIGQLIATIIQCNQSRHQTLSPQVIHSVAPEEKLLISEASWLCLKINDQTGELADNTGHYEVTINATR